MPSIEVENLFKSYPVYRHGSQRLAEMLLLQTVSFHHDFWALQDVSFTVGDGESFGIIGVNGSGKSTLLQILAGILRSTRGTARIRGRIAALLELGSGFNHEFTGRENVYMNASILGMSRQEIQRRFAAIEDFAEIGSFIDQPVRTYSSGMMMRLAFSVAINVDPEILIIDEALAVGDAYFRQRCLRRVHQMREAGTTIVFVSHYPTDIKAFCDRCLWLDHGRIREIGPADMVLARYLAFVFNKISTSSNAPSPRVVERANISSNLEFRLRAGGHRYGNGKAEILAAGLVDEFGQEVQEAHPAMNVTLRITAIARTFIDRPLVGFLLRNRKGEIIFGTNTTRDIAPMQALAAEELFSCDFSFAMPELYPAPYSISVGLSEGTLDKYEVCDYVEDAVSLTVLGDPRDVRGYIRLACSVGAHELTGGIP